MKNVIKRYAGFNYCLVAIICAFSLGVVSCGTPQNIKKEKPRVKQSLNINFNDNIQSIDPYRAKSRSEHFIKELIFDRLINNDGSSSIISTIRHNPSTQLYRFELASNRYFHDGTAVDTKAIKSSLLVALNNQNKSTLLKKLMQSTEGITKINWLRKNQSLLDSLPIGIQFQSKYQFSILCSLDSANLVRCLQDPIMMLSKEVDDEIIGSGEYKITHANEDILYTLRKVKPEEIGINSINLRFIKNKEVEIEEFTKGALDLISFDPHHSTDQPKQIKFQNYIASKYPPFQITASPRGTITYALISNLNDSALLSTLLHELKNHKFPWVVSTTSSGTKSQINEGSAIYDSLEHNPVHLVDKTDRFFHFYYTRVDSTILQFENSGQLIEYPNAPQIVINEMVCENINELEPRETIEKILTALKTEAKVENSMLMILENKKEYFICDYSLIGLEPYQDLSQNIDKLKFIQPKKY